MGAYIANDYFYFRLIGIVKNLFRFEVRNMSKKLGFLICVLVIFASSCLAQSVSPPQDQSQTQAQIGYKSAAGADEKKTLLLRDFHPASMLHAPAHNVDRAKYYVIDIHNHVNDAMRIDDHMPPERVI